MYRFQSVRTYAVKLTVTDAAGSSANKTQNVTVTAGNDPTANIVTSPSSPGQFETVTFNGSRSTAAAGRTVVSYAWNFGDPKATNGGTATGVIATHKYDVTGTYTATLTVTDSAGLTNVGQSTVTVASGVTADFTISPTSPVINQVVILNAEASKGGSEFGSKNPITKYIWNFGITTDIVTESDPITSVENGDNHGFPTAKTYTINLTVEDSAGRRATTSKTVTVTSSSSVSVVAP